MADDTPIFLFFLALGLIGTGCISGVLAGLLGVGGGIVIVPVLFILFDFLDISPNLIMHVAVATSLATIIPTSLSSARAHQRKGAIDTALFTQWAPVIFAGALLGGIMSKYLDAHALILIFGLIALFVALNMALPKKYILATSLPKNILSRGLLPSFIGMISALMGIGGGTLSVPLLSAFSVPIHRAIGTASAFGLVIAVPAVIGFIWAGWSVPHRPSLSLGYVNIPAAFLIFSASVITAPLGARLAHSLNPDRLKKLFAIFLFITALRMLWRAFS